MSRLAFVVDGTPVGQGRVSFYGKGRAVHSNAKTLLPWRDAIAKRAATVAELDGWTVPDGPVVVRARFYLARPKHHHGARGLRPSAPTHPAGRPDLDHLLRALGDALTGIAFRDDSQIVRFHASKHYVGREEAMQAPGLVVEVAAEHTP